MKIYWLENGIGAPLSERLICLKAFVGFMYATQVGFGLPNGSGEPFRCTIEKMEVRWGLAVRTKRIAF